MNSTTVKTGLIRKLNYLGVAIVFCTILSAPALIKHSRWWVAPVLTVALVGNFLLALSNRKWPQKLFEASDLCDGLTVTMMIMLLSMGGFLSAEHNSIEYLFLMSCLALGYWVLSIFATVLM